METIVVNSQLSFENYYKINRSIAWRKMRWIVGIMVVCSIYLFSTTKLADWDNSSLYSVIGVLVFYVIGIPIINYLAVRRNYRKIKSMSEEKVYEFGDTNVKLTGQSISATLDWSVIEKIKEGKTDFIAFVSNGKGVHFLPKNGFTSDEAIKEFKALVKAKSIKNNFKS